MDNYLRTSQRLSTVSHVHFVTNIHASSNLDKWRSQLGQRTDHPLWAKRARHQPDFIQAGSVICGAEVAHLSVADGAGAELERRCIPQFDHRVLPNRWSGRAGVSRTVLWRYWPLLRAFRETNSLPNNRWLSKSIGITNSSTLSLDEDDFPVLQLKVSKLQKQVKEMRKFMRGLVQLQVEQYEPATILIQAWWRGCLVRPFFWNPQGRTNIGLHNFLWRSPLCLL